MPIPIIDATRQNHALEHATISILLQRLPQPVRLIGRSTPFGFYIHGDVPTEPLIES
ncbi:MAG: DUF6391 domain-containing protein, partial [Dehalococcoidia bacterium]|nr:DUF6391 domain-containing protein [Dehalococcoidia bacterium]